MAAPCRFDAIAMAITLGTGDISSFFEMVMATGATISTVATLSTNADIKPAKTERAIIAHFTSGTLLSIISARREGIPDSIKRSTIPIVPVIIKITFQSISVSTSPKGSVPEITNKAAEARATYARYLGRNIISK